jgi:hypothetical protein
MLVKYGVSRDSVSVVLYPATDRDRTYHAAIATGKWLDETGRTGRTVNVATPGPHARRSRLIYTKALANKAEVGVVPLQDPRYDPRHWWRTSEGVRDVLGEAIAYVYARFFFSWT